MRYLSVIHLLLNATHLRNTPHLNLPTGPSPEITHDCALLLYIDLHTSDHPISISTFLDEFSSYLESVVICSEPLIITGDFNIHMDNPSDSKQFSELLESISLTQHVHQPTHVIGHTLDLIITRSSDHILCSDPTTDELFSDHFSISCLLSFAEASPRKQGSNYPPEDDRSTALL